jgi:hypothetical protein
MSEDEDVEVPIVDHLSPSSLGGDLNIQGHCLKTQLIEPRRHHDTMAMPEPLTTRLRRKKKPPPLPRGRRGIRLKRKYSFMWYMGLGC